MWSLHKSDSISQSCAMASEKGEEIENNEETTSLYVEKSVLNF